MFYPDASALVAIYVGEEGSERIWDWLADKTDQLAVSGWLHVEFASALALKERSRAIAVERRRAAMQNFHREWLEGAEMLAIPPAVYSRAASMIDLAAGLRTGDALHLAIAEAHDAVLFTLDVRQAELGSDLGVRTLLL